MTPFLHLQRLKSLWWFFPSYNSLWLIPLLPSFTIFKDPCDNIGPPWKSRISSLFADQLISNLKSISTLIPFCHVFEYIHRLWGFGLGHFGEDCFLFETSEYLLMCIAQRLSSLDRKEEFFSQSSASNKYWSRDISLSINAEVPMSSQAKRVLDIYEMTLGLVTSYGKKEILPFRVWYYLRITTKDTYCGSI